jgi:predicted AlkP superfamily phosphohydrolase/phosphomutase
MRLFRRSALALLSLAILAPACSRSPQAHPAARVLVVGVDGLEWNVLRPLLAQGRCPNLRALMERGSFGRLETMQPTFSPIVWTTIATGRMPEDHGILGFTDAEVQGKAYTSSQRRVRAVWNIADRYGLSSDVFGWWITWPAEAIRGLMVSGSSSAALFDDNWKPALLPGIPRQVEPRALEPEVLAIAKKAGSIEEVHRLAREMVFGNIPDATLGDVERKLMKQTLWSIQSDATFFEECRQLMPSHRADLNFVYLGGPDVVGHRFWRYYEPEKFRWPGDAAADARWKEISPDSAPLEEILATKDGEKSLALVIPSEYQWIDRMIGELVKAAGPDTTVIVCSDHGFHAFATDEPNAKFVTGHHLDSPPGVIVAAGPCIRRGGDVDAFLAGGELPSLGSVLDVTPTLLALLGIPRSLEMPGQGMKTLLDGAARANADLPPIASHDEGFRAPSSTPLPPDMERNFQERFGNLGYIGSEDEPPPRKKAGEKPK